MHRSRVWARALAAVFIAASGVEAQKYPPAIAFTHVGVVDVAKGSVRPDQTVILTGNRITSVGPASGARVPAEALVVDATGKFMIPGLWDFHVHAVTPGMDELDLPLLVANGVTGVRDMFGRLEFTDSTRAKLAREDFIGPTSIVAAGHILDGKPAIWPGSIGVGTADEARRAVDSLATRGAPFIKVYSRLSPEAYRAAAAEAKRHRIPFAGHVPTLVSVAEASDLGQATIEHLTGLLGACSTRDDALRTELMAAVASPKGWDSVAIVNRRRTDELLTSFDQARCTAIGQRLARNRTWLVPTIVTLRATSHLDDTTLAADPRMKYVPPFWANSWNPKNDFRFRMLTASDWAVRHRVYDRQLEIIGVLHRAGVRFLAGTDLLNPYTFPGFSLHEELARFVEAGFTPAEALRAATLGPAEFLGATDSLGTVAPGKRADLVLLDANPLADIHNTTRISSVVLNGRLYRRGRLDELLVRGEKLARSP